MSKRKKKFGQITKELEMNLILENLIKQKLKKNKSYD